MRQKGLSAWGWIFVAGCLAAGCSDSDSTTSSSLPLPSEVSRTEYQEKLYDFLGDLRYRRLGWQRDKGIRDTGPYRDGTYYGTHPAVRVYYSPEVMDWLNGGRGGAIPDGGIIIKEMYPPPAARYEGLSEAEWPMPTWTVMTRDSGGSIDGWFWSFFDSDTKNSDPPIPQEPDGHEFPFKYPDSDFGSYCVRCHASADSELTFITTENIEGFPGEPIEYDVDDSWRNDPDGPGEDPHPNDLPPPAPSDPTPDFVNEDWLALYDQFPRQDPSTIASLPAVSHDRVTADGHNQFVSSDQCEPCHSGDTSAFGPNLTSEKLDISPFGEWRWSMMGLAGRDPIFYAQLETETTLHGQPDSQLPQPAIENFCLHCHGVMGQRHFVLDNPGELFTVDKALAHMEDDPLRAYGGLARDGISCMACHRIADDSAMPLADVQNGNFIVDPPEDGVVTVYGPFEEPSEYSMSEALALRPVHGPHIEKSRLCASCHTVFLPVLDENGRVVDEKFEQSTFLEWVNSDFRDGLTGTKSCQDCHMPDSFGGHPLPPMKIANIQDQDFPITSFLAPLDEIKVEPREGYRRHVLLGINVFALELFRGFPDVLGVRHKGFMTGFESGLPHAIQNATDLAANDSAQVEILGVERNGDEISAMVKVTNLVGHRLPSGVGFRRMILEFLVLDDSGDVMWGSGRTNTLGVIVDENGTPLPSEFHANDPQTNEQAYEPHHQTVRSQRSAQIYEELLKDTLGRFTTSFLARAEDVKDNRLMPLGWTAEGPPGFAPEFAEATAPHGSAASDADFIDGTGSDTLTYVAHLPAGASEAVEVRATLYYQAIPPRYLMDRFTQANGPATRRLHYMGAHLDDRETAFAGWKLPLASAAVSVP